MTLAAALAWARPAAAADAERITTFDASLTLSGDGRLAVTERIAYDFGGNDRHGIFRYVPNRYRCTGSAIGPSCPEGYERRLSIDVVDVRADGAAVPWESKQEGSNLVLRIGDPDRTITGAHEYELRYAVTGALNPTEGGGAVLGWNVTGNAWTVPIELIRFSIDPEPAGAVCTTGPAGSDRPCDSGFPGVGPGEGWTITARYPAGVVAVPAPVLYQPQTLKRAFSFNAGAIGVGAITGAAGAAAAVAVGRRGRDRRFVGGPVEIAMGQAGQPDELVPLFGHQPDVMEFAPPAGVRPGQLGSLLDERVQHRDVTATIVDLAVRGHLRITELEDDWLIERGEKPADGLLPYEKLLHGNLLSGHDQVRLGELTRQWSTRYADVRSAMYDDMVANGWYNGRPDRSRRGAMATAMLLQFGGTGLTGGLAARTTVALGGLPLVVGGVATMAVARKAGARTALGTAMTTRGRGFRRLIETPTQQEMAKMAERDTIFMEYLPYAIAFGCASQWAKRFEGLGLDPAVGYGTWFVPFAGRGFASGDRSWDRITSGISSFSATAGTALTAAAVSGGSTSGGSSGGFSSGGGFGGGGGGSW